MATTLTLTPGDRVSVPKALVLKHSMIYIGNGQFVEKRPTGQVQLRSVADFPPGQLFELVFRPHPMHAQAIVSRALARLGPEPYDVLNANCEHFANEVIYGRPRSEQVEDFSIGACFGAALLLLGAVFGD